MARERKGRKKGGPGKAAPPAPESLHVPVETMEPPMKDGSDYVGIPAPEGSGEGLVGAQFTGFPFEPRDETPAETLTYSVPGEAILLEEGSSLQADARSFDLSALPMLPSVTVVGGEDFERAIDRISTDPIPPGAQFTPTYEHASPLERIVAPRINLISRHARPYDPDLARLGAYGRREKIKMKTAAYAIGAATAIGEVASFVGNTAAAFWPSVVKPMLTDARDSALGVVRRYRERRREPAESRPDDAPGFFATYFPRRTRRWIAGTTLGLAALLTGAHYLNRTPPPEQAPKHVYALDIGDGKRALIDDGVGDNEHHLFPQSKEHKAAKLAAMIADAPGVPCPTDGSAPCIDERGNEVVQHPYDTQDKRIRIKEFTVELNGVKYDFRIKGAPCDAPCGPEYATPDKPLAIKDVKDIEGDIVFSMQDNREKGMEQRIAYKTRFDSLARTAENAFKDFRLTPAEREALGWGKGDLGDLIERLTPAIVNQGCAKEYFVESFRLSPAARVVQEYLQASPPAHQNDAAPVEPMSEMPVEPLKQEPARPVNEAVVTPGVTEQRYAVEQPAQQLSETPVPPLAAPPQGQPIEATWSQLPAQQGERSRAPAQSIINPSIKIIGIGATGGDVANIVGVQQDDWQYIGQGEPWRFNGIEFRYNAFTPETMAEVKAGSANLRTDGGHVAGFNLPSERADVAYGSVDVKHKLAGPLVVDLAAALQDTAQERDAYFSGSGRLGLGLVAGDFNDWYLGAAGTVQKHMAGEGGPLQSDSLDLGVNAFAGKHFWKDGAYKGRVYADYDMSEPESGDSFFERSQDARIGGVYNFGERFGIGLEVDHEKNNINMARAGAPSEAEGTKYFISLNYSMGGAKQGAAPQREAQQGVQVSPGYALNAAYSGDVRHVVDVALADCHDTYVPGITGQPRVIDTTGGDIILALQGGNAVVYGVVPDGKITSPPLHACAVPEGKRQILDHALMSDPAIAGVAYK